MTGSGQYLTLLSLVQIKVNFDGRTLIVCLPSTAVAKNRLVEHSKHMFPARIKREGG